jgi:serine/threonine protein kinase
VFRAVHKESNNEFAIKTA